MCKTSGTKSRSEADRVIASLRRFDPPARPVAISWRDDADLPAYYLPPGAAAGGGAPAVICVGETRSGGSLFRLLARPSRDRGLALLCVDLGSPDAALLRDSVRPESCISSLIDHLTSEPGIDPARIAVMGDGSASSLVARGIVFDGRAAAAVCDGGLWELWACDHAPSPPLLSDRSPPPGLAMPCPTLILLHPRHGLDPSHARRLYAPRLANGSDRKGPGRMDFGIGLAGGAGLSVGPILDWVRDRLGE